MGPLKSPHKKTERIFTEIVSSIQNSVSLHERTQIEKKMRQHKNLCHLLSIVKLGLPTPAACRLVCSIPYVHNGKSHENVWWLLIQVINCILFSLVTLTVVPT